MLTAEAFCGFLLAQSAAAPGQDLPVRLAGQDLLLIQNPASARQILQHNQQNYLKNMDWFAQVLGTSRMTANGTDWLARRDLSQKFLARFHQDKTHRACQLYARRAAQALLASVGPGGTAADRVPPHLLREMALGVAFEVFFDLSPEALGCDIRDVTALIEQASQLSFQPADEVRAFLSKPRLLEILRLRSRVMQSLEPLRHHAADTDSLLAHLQQAEAAGAAFTLEHEILLFIAAGAETTASTVGWVLYLVSRDAGLQQRLRAQLQSGPAAGEPDLLSAVIDEALSLFPPTPALGRRAIGPDRLDGARVAAGAQIIVSLIGVQRALRAEQPPAVPGSGPRSLAFGAGARVCGGAKFAAFELRELVAGLLTHLSFHAAGPEAPEFIWTTQLLHQGGLPLKVSAVPPPERGADG